jgi:acyl-CoA synthetase (AMP-forming)/AMP-acid ligase II
MATGSRAHAPDPGSSRITDYLWFWAEVAPHREALVLGEIRYTYAEVARLVRAESRALWRHGLRPNETASVLSAARPEFFVTFLAIVSMGGVYQGLSPKSALPELEYQVADARPKVIVWHGSSENGSLAEQVAAEISGRPRVLSGKELRRSAASSGDSSASDSAATHVRSEQPAAIVYTSGTTGRPKGAMLPHRGFTLCGAVQDRRWSVSGPLRMVCVEPINHVAAVADACVCMLVAGGTVVFQEHFDAVGMLALLPEERINFWYTDPAILSLCTRSSKWVATDLTRVERICWSGGRAPLTLVENLTATGIQLSTSWGMTETVGSLTYTDDDATSDVLSSTIGKLDESFEGRVVSPDDTAVVPGETGELQVRGPHIVREYWHRPDATNEAFTSDGWFRTGDLVVRWDDGNLELVGRRSEMFKSGGENIYPREVEAALESHSAVSAAAVVARKDELWGEVGHAFIVVSSPVTEDELREHVRTQLARFKVPKTFSFLDAFPLLGSGKVDRRALRELSERQDVHG